MQLLHCAALGHLANMRPCGSVDSATLIDNNHENPFQEAYGLSPWEEVRRRTTLNGR